jgi:hypothetical protein
MAALTDTNTDLFGAIGVSNPEVFKTGIAIKRSVNFKESPILDDYNYEFLPIPAGFVMTGVYVKETAKCAAGTLTLKAKNDSATIGAAFSVGAATLAEVFNTPVAGDTAGDKTFLAGDMLCVKASADMGEGAVEVVIHGYLMNGGSLNANELAVPYRAGQTDAEREGNVSGGDLYLKKVAADA